MGACGGSSRRGAASAMECSNRAYQATRLYSTPPVYGEHDERRETGDYGLTHMAMTITKLRCFDAVIHYLKPSEAARLLSTRKIFGLRVEAAEEQVVRHIYALHFGLVALPATIVGAAGWTRYLHELSSDKRKKVLIMGGHDHARATNRVDMMVIDDEGTKISWQACAPMIKNRREHAALFSQGKVLSVGCFDGDGQGTSEHYDVLSQTSVELEHKLPLPNLCHVAMAELEGLVFVIGGVYDDAANRRDIISDRVLCLDTKEHRGQAAGMWIEQEARLVTASSRYGAAAAAYQNKIWLAGGIDRLGKDLTSVEVFDPLVGSWQAAGDLTNARDALSIGLFAIKQDLFAGGTKLFSSGLWIEKYDVQIGTFRLVSECREDCNRTFCAVVACGSTIYFIGGDDSQSSTSWNSFNTQTGTWASHQRRGQYKDVATRQLPRSFRNGQAVCITPSEQLSGLGTWTSYPDFVH